MPKSNSTFIYINQQGVPHSQSQIPSNIRQADLQSFNEARKQKYKLKAVLKSLDIEHTNTIGVEHFLTIAKDNEIQLSQSDQQFLRNKLANSGKVNYENVTKDLALIAVPSGFDIKRDVGQQENPGLIEDVSFLHSNNLLRINKKFKTPSSHSQQRFRSNNESQMNSVKDNIHQQKQSTRPGSVKAQSHIQHTQLSQDDRTDSASSLPTMDFNTINSHGTQQTSARKYVQTKMKAYTQGYSKDMQQVLKKILVIKKKKKADEEVDYSKYISAASKTINIPKNKQNKIYIKSVQAGEKIQNQKSKIRKYMKENDVDIMHLNAISSVFLDCDDARTGIITKKQLILQIHEQNLQFPADFLFNLISDIQDDPTDESEEAILNFMNLKNIIEIYSNCPLGDSNNSANFKANMDFTNTELNANGGERVDKLLRYINARIEEKFKGFRQAFRNFDKDFGGSIDFKEFIEGMESIGVRLKLNDFRLVFERIDFDGKGIIDFQKFCLLNSDKRNELEQMIESSKRAQAQSACNQVQTPVVGGHDHNSRAGKKPPLPPLFIAGQEAIKRSGNPLFGDGNIPKNKDMNGFNKDVQMVTPTQQFIQQRRVKKTPNYMTYQDVPSQHSFGAKNSKEHDMVAILTNSYQDDLHSVTVETLKASLQKQKLQPAKNTAAQEMREKANKMKYLPLNRSASSSMQDFVDPSTGLVRRRRLSGTYSIPSKHDGNRSYQALSIQGSRHSNYNNNQQQSTLPPASGKKYY